MAAAGFVAALAVVSVAAVAVLRGRSAGAPAGVPFGARAIPVDPSASPAPLSPVSPGSDSRLLARPGDAPLTGAGLDPDAQRVVDVTGLQLSLERYRLAWGAYPDALDRLFPDFAPVQNGRKLAAVPVDPISHQPYGYRLLSTNAYEISATMSTGRPWHGVHR